MAQTIDSDLERPVGLKLNKISDEIARGGLNRNLAMLNDLLERGPHAKNAFDLENYFHAVGDTSCDVGLTMYQQEKSPREIRPYMVMAADFLLREHMVRQKPAPNTSRNPWLFKKTVELIIGWGDSEKGKALTNIEPWQYRNPPHPEHDRISEYIKVLVNFLVERCLNVEACRSVEERLASDSASRDERSILLPGARGLRGAVEGDSKLWNDAIAELVAAHAVEAKKGEYKRSESGFICLPALALAKLGLERGLTSSVRSVYLPLEIMG